MAIEIKIVVDPFALSGPVPKSHRTKEEIERVKRELAVQRERDERHRQRLIELGRIPPQNEASKD